MALSGGAILQYSSLYYSKRKGSLLSDNISIIQLTRLSESCNEHHIHVLLQLYVENCWNYIVSQ